MSTERYRHLKSGGEYDVVGRASLQGDAHEPDALIVYRGADGRLWAREEGEFNDGRFEALPARLDAKEPGRAAYEMRWEGYTLGPRGASPTWAELPEHAREVWARVERGAAPLPFQPRVQPWMLACFGEMIAGDREERNHRFLEEALELVQACGCSWSEAHQLVDYTFERPAGEPAQEVGGVMVTLAALCLAQDLDMHASAETELARVWTKVDKIRAKQAAKPRFSPLPEAVAPTRRLYLDLDGVMADFDAHFPAVFGLDHRGMADDAMWKTINAHPSYFRDMPPCPGAIAFFRSIEHLRPIILTACPRSSYPHVARQKRAWVREQLSEHVTVLPVLGGRNKPLFMQEPGDILIDDWDRNTEAWEQAGGVAILHRDFETTSAKLAALATPTAATAQPCGMAGTGAGTEGFVLVPREPTEAMWGGLARQIVMWSRQSRATGANLHRDLKNCGWLIPDWLGGEIKDADYVPPKGAVAVAIYRAMLASAPVPQPRPASGAQAGLVEVLGRFDHHPDPAIDFCVEVEVLEGMAYDARVGADDANLRELSERIRRAITFRVGGDEIAVRSKAALRKLEAEVSGLAASPPRADGDGALDAIANGICPVCYQGLPDYCRKCDEQWLCDKSGCAQGKLTLEAPDDIVASLASRAPSPAAPEQALRGAAQAWRTARLAACAAPIGDASVWTNLGNAETALSEAVAALATISPTSKQEG